MEWLSFIGPAAQISAVGALVVVLVLLIRLVSSGDWVSKRELDYVRSDRDARLSEKDAEIAYLRGAHETSERARELLNASTRDALAALRTQEHFFQALQGFADRKDQGDVQP